MSGAVRRHGQRRERPSRGRDHPPPGGSFCRRVSNLSPALKTLEHRRHAPLSGRRFYHHRSGLAWTCRGRADCISTAPRRPISSGRASQFARQALPADWRAPTATCAPQRSRCRRVAGWQVSDGVAGETTSGPCDLLAGWDGTRPGRWRRSFRQSVQRTGGADDCAVLVLAIDGRG